MKNEIYEYSWRVDRGINRIHFNKEYNYHQGTVLTPHGIVSVYAQGDERFSNHTMLEIVHNGRCYNRSFKKRYSPRGIVTKARQFAEEMYCGENA